MKSAQMEEYDAKVGPVLIQESEAMVFMEPST